MRTGNNAGLYYIMLQAMHWEGKLQAPGMDGTDCRGPTMPINETV